VDEEELILGQIDYYRQRAPEYDETSSPPGNPLAPHGQRIEDALDAFAPAGKVLEIASGTGTWTRHLLEHASELAALDSSPEMHEQSRKKIRDERVRYIERDVFSWEPDDTYDVVFFANWLSHVPPSAFEQFWAIVERALAPEGRVMFVDEVGDAWRNEDLREEFVQGPTVPDSATTSQGWAPSMSSRCSGSRLSSRRGWLSWVGTSTTRRQGRSSAPRGTGSSPNAPVASC